jgi:hypothetical protein
MPQAAGWLQMLHEHVAEPRVGAVGATGSWESFYTNYLRRLERVNRDRSRVEWAKMVVRQMRLRRYRKFFQPMPNPHLRSTGFMIERSLWLSLHSSRFETKWDTYLFESGRDGMTAQLLRRGLRVLVIGRDGVGYAPEEWPISATFRADDQRNLLIGDNRTREFEGASPDDRELLNRLAWSVG